MRDFSVKPPNSYPIGREALVKDLKHDGLLVGARVIDKVARTKRAKRIRLTTGPDAGDTRSIGEFLLMEFV